ncbi:nucleotidyltransferase family protein [Fibrisoma montanum]|uniref:Nucleotidyltransferase family protein n=1 Tax=Fibrisoma montanum TaxID=2305895 RepID=A0A418M0I8_9BACT|nr:nucleotidyltransferase family protein [Fibrisoma montanum]RIV19053.1 nucleotidyltransferase family protein [Fibrisoma montanum]
MQIGSIILAAGAATRFEGQPKQLLTLNGTTLVQRITQTALTACPNGPVVVVVGANQDRIRPELLNYPVTVVDNPHWSEGMATSLKAGLNSLLSRHPALDAVLVLLCDQPLITPDVLQALIGTHEQTGQPIVACRYAGSVGVPALFAHAYFDKLLALTGDQGARYLLKNNKTDLAEVGFELAAIDLDSWQDVDRFNQSQSDDNQVTPGR